MISTYPLSNFQIGRAGGLVVVLAVSLSGCATTQSKRAPARIEIQEQIGFTITEEARISSGVSIRLRRRRWTISNRAVTRKALHYSKRLQMGRHN